MKKFNFTLTFYHSPKIWETFKNQFVAKNKKQIYRDAEAWAEEKAKIVGRKIPYCLSVD